jgi:Na+/proline symporter
MSYNITQIGAGNTTISIIQNTNTVLVGGWLGVLILVMVVVIAFMNFVFTTKDPKKSTVGSMFVGFLAALILFAMELVPIIAVWVCIVGLGVGIAFYRLD